VYSLDEAGGQLAFETKNNCGVCLARKEYAGYDILFAGKFFTEKDASPFNRGWA
jgi:hypothetical protein